MLTSVPVRGLRPMPVLRARTLNTPNQRNSMRSPAARASFKPFKHSVDCRFGLGAGQACALDHMVHDVLFNQSGHLASATVLDSTTPYRTDGTAFGSFVEHRLEDFCTL